LQYEKIKSENCSKNNRFYQKYANQSSDKLNYQSFTDDVNNLYKLPKSWEIIGYWNGETSIVKKIKS